MPHVFAAGFGLDGEARRHRQAGIGHLGQAGAFAAEFVLHLAVAIGLAAAEEIDVLGAGCLLVGVRFLFRGRVCVAMHESFSVSKILWILAFGHDLGEIGDRGEFLHQGLQQCQPVGANALRRQPSPSLCRRIVHCRPELGNFQQRRARSSSGREGFRPFGGHCGICARQFLFRRFLQSIRHSNVGAIGFTGLLRLPQDIPHALAGDGDRLEIRQRDALC